LKGGGRVDTLSGGEVAEWLNAAVSKTVTSVIPASGVRIPPSPPPLSAIRAIRGQQDSAVSFSAELGKVRIQKVLAGR
jgi:hypothetical protein